MTASADAPGTAGGPGRIPAVDAGRALAVFAVILIHTKPFLNPAQDYGTLGYAGVITDQVARFGVPFFFTFAGYFFARKVRRDGAGSAFLHYGVRIYAAFLFWSLIYLALPRIESIATLGYLDAVTGRIQSTGMLQLLWEGTAPQLWYLTTLILAAGSAALLYRLGLERYLLAIALAAYLTGLVAGPYSAVFVGEDTGMRRGLLFGLLPLAIGFQGALKERCYDLRSALLMLAAGYALQLFEAFALWRWFGIYPLELDNLLGTALIAAGLFRLTLAGQNLVPEGPLARIGRYALGIYASHWLFVKLLLPVDRYAGSALWEVLYPILVMILALTLSRAMAGVPALRGFVR
jgi:surface polysaccharide O-acyltransferase-like enzyme